MLTETNDYEKLCRDFRWEIPARFNLATACCDRHADGSNRLALIYVDEDGKALDDEYYEIKLTDGKSPKGKWPKGQAEQSFDQIPEGTCTITFPKLKDNGWKAPGKK